MSLPPDTRLQTAVTTHEIRHLPVKCRLQGIQLPVTTILPPVRLAKQIGYARVNTEHLTRAGRCPGKQAVIVVCPMGLWLLRGAAKTVIDQPVLEVLKKVLARFMFRHPQLGNHLRLALLRLTAGGIELLMGQRRNPEVRLERMTGRKMRFVQNRPGCCVIDAACSAAHHGYC